MRPLALVLLLLASVLGSRGTTLAPAPAVSDSPEDQEQTSSPPEPVIALAPVILPTAPPAQPVSPAPEKGVVIPPIPTEPQYAPTPVTPPKAPPTVIAPPDPTEVPLPVAPPQAAVENLSPMLPGTPPYVQAPTPSVTLKPNPPPMPPPVINQPSSPINPTPILPGIPPLPPSVQAPAPSATFKPNPPAVPPPSMSDQPSRPVRSVPPYPLPAFPPLMNDVLPYPSTGIFTAIPPSTSVPHVKPPTASSVTAQVPRQKAAAPNRNTVLPASTPLRANLKNHRASPPKGPSGHTAPVHKSPITGSAPATSPLPQNTNVPSTPKNASALPHAQPSPASVPPEPAPASRSTPGRKSNNPKSRANPSFSPSNPPSHAQGSGVSRTPRQAGTKRQNHHAPPPIPQGHPSFSVHSPSPQPVPSRGQTNGHKRHHISPTIPPIPPEPEPTAPSAHPIWTLPPPPPNLDCKLLSCPEPLTDPPSGAPCACVLPIRVAIHLSVDLYSFFPLVSDFAKEVSSGVNMAQRQVRVMGANVANDQPGKTVVLVDLVPMQVKFDNATEFSAFESLWNKKLPLKPSVFGDYEILYVVYPGLPPSPPSATESADDGALGKSRNSRAMKPLGVNVTRPQKKVNGSLVAISVLSTVMALIICCLVAWLLIHGFRGSSNMSQRFPHSVLPKFSRSSGTGHTQFAGRYSSPSGPPGSLGSSFATYTRQAKTFKFVEIDKATGSFDDSKVLGEGGFGCVYQGTLEDGTSVAVKVLKRCDGQGEREFLAEVEMLGRLHHRNLVKLLGICVEENARCLVYELIPNGSVEFHLHGAERETPPLDWNARMKIALGSARALAYLHEDANPCVIHRDFKSSNILLEHDFTPKVSDFGLARTARGENQHISTRVMGTFGYVAPEYAMTGHLLVKSDVYSYGVVLLELLTGRKPVDMSQPAGEENLVVWARPLLTNVLSLRQAVDPLLGPSVPMDSVAKAAAIAQMCVQPEVAHRPSMGEVVQALKLVCSEGDDCLGSSRFSQELPVQTTAVYDVIGMEAERVLLSEIFGSTPIFTPAAETGSFRKQSSSGPLVTGNNRKFWQRLRSLSRGSMSEHGFSPDYETRSQYSGR